MAYTSESTRTFLCISRIFIKKKIKVTAEKSSLLIIL